MRDTFYLEIRTGRYYAYPHHDQGCNPIYLNKAWAKKQIDNKFAKLVKVK